MVIACAEVLWSSGAGCFKDMCGQWMVCSKTRAVNRSQTM